MYRMKVHSGDAIIALGATILAAMLGYGFSQYSNRLRALTYSETFSPGKLTVVVRNNTDRDFQNVPLRVSFIGKDNTRPPDVIRVDSNVPVSTGKFAPTASNVVDYHFDVGVWNRGFDAVLTFPLNETTKPRFDVSVTMAGVIVEPESPWSKTLLLCGVGIVVALLLFLLARRRGGQANAKSGEAQTAETLMEAGV